MYTPQWQAAVFAQVLLAIVAVACSRAAFGTRKSMALVAVVVTFAVPITNVPGYSTPLMLHDFVAPILGAFLLWKGIPGRYRGLLLLSVVALVLWPTIGIANGWYLGDTYSASGVAVYRKVALVVFLGGALLHRHEPDDLKGLLNTVCIVWCLMCLVGIGQYLGWIDTNFRVASDAGPGQNLYQYREAHVGFLGLNRGAVGVWSSSMFAAAAAALAGGWAQGRGSALLWAATAALSTGVVLLSGSRTGLVAMMVASIVVLLGASVMNVRRTVAAVATLCVAAGLVLVPLLNSTTDLLSTRWKSAEGITELDSFIGRREVQLAVLSYVFADPRTLVLGRGPSVDAFSSTLNVSLAHAHSEYVQVLWESGAVGVALYLGFVLMLMGRVGLNGDKQSALVVRGMLVAGLTSGLSVGNLVVWDTRLCTYGIALMVICGTSISSARHRRSVRNNPRSFSRPVTVPVTVRAFGGIHA